MSKSDDIRKIFESHGKKLLEQKKQMNETLNVWRNKRFREIDEHVAEQKKRLDEECERHKDLLEQQRQQFTKEVSSLEKKKDKEHIRHLIDQFKELKFQLAAFKNIKREVEFIQLMAEDQQTQTNQNKRSANEADEKRSQKPPTTYHENTTNNETEKGNSSSKPSFASERQAR